MKGEGPWLARRPVAVLLSRFPCLTETFILREIQEMERQGQPVRLVPLLRETPPVVHPEALPWVGRALYTPFLSVSILRANLRAAFHRPTLYLGILLRLILSTLHRPRFLIGTLGIFPKSVYLAALLEQERISHLHAHFGSHPATAAFIMSAFSGASFSVTLHAHDLFMPRYTPFLGPKLRAAAFVRVISEFNRRYLLDHFPEVAPEKVHVVHVGIPVGDYRPLEPEGVPAVDPMDLPARRSPGDEPEVRILAVAGLRPYKGLSVLVDACRRLRDEGVAFRCTIVGEGPSRRSLERQITNAGLQGWVLLAGAMTQGRVAQMLRERPIFVHPSVALPNGMMDGIPVALMEAMAAGAPVLASRLSGIPELIEDGVSGILVEPRDATSLARWIRRVAEDPLMARALGKAGAEKVRAGFSLSRCTEELLELTDRHNTTVAKALPPSPAWQLHSRDAHAGPAPACQRRYGVRMLHDGPDSRVAGVLLPASGQPRALVVKVHRDRRGQSRPPAGRARHEFDVMIRLTSLWGNGDGGSRRECGPAPVPRPVGLDAEAGLLVLEESPGRRLDELIREARTGKRPQREAAMAAFEHTGRWLRRFQELTAPSVDEGAALRAWRDEARLNLQRCAPALPDRIRFRADQALDVSWAPSAGGRDAAAGHHGDFWPGNVMVVGDGVQVLDFEGYRPGAALQDPAYFLLQAELFFDLPVLRRSFRPLGAAFVRGYGREGLLAQESYRACRVSACLRLLALACGDADSPAGSRHRRRMLRLRSRLEETLW